ncbi:MAG: tetratricopeptide repeat protein, partial [Bacteroidota bacterium]|nr:tetratricopeptide repeat protein [Bacteroidota bacterium]
VIKNDIDQNTKNDATIRLADCQYMLKDFGGAVKQYEDFINKNSTNIDYATYQKAMAEGASGNQHNKSLTLQQAIKDFPNSSYRPAFFYELGNTYLATNQNEKALSTYQTLINTYPDNTFTKDCLGKVGMLQYQLGRNDQALSTLDDLVRKYPNSKQSQAALSIIKNIYMDKGRPEEYITYVNNLGTTKISNQEKEDMLYQVAENKYMDEDYTEAITLFKNYLNAFPKGTFVTKTEYYLADCLQRTNDTIAAGEYFYKVGMKPYGTYTEKSLLNAGKIYRNRDLNKALEIYKRLDGITSTATNKLLAQKEVMNIYYSQKDYSNAIAWASEIESNEGGDKNIIDEAYFVLAESYFAQNQQSQAMEYVEKLKKSSSQKYSSYAQYSLALMEFENKNLDKSENIIRQMSKNGADDYYLAKAFILWSDIFVAKGNDFQAKQTLQSIIDNYDESDDIVSIAKTKLQLLSDKSNREKQENEQKLQNQENSVDEVII